MTDVLVNVADGKPLNDVVADVIAIVADGIAALWDGWCYYHCGRWNSHTGWNVVKAGLIAFVADGIAVGSLILIWIMCCLIEPHPICEMQMVFTYISVQGWVVDP